MTNAENATIKEMQHQISSLLEQVKLLTEQNQMLRQRLFGRKSEKKINFYPDEQLNLMDMIDCSLMFNEAEAVGTPAVPEPQLEEITYKRRKKKGKREMDFGVLPTQQIIHELSERERICPNCKGELHACGHDVLRRELTVIPAQYMVTEHVQTVYSCRDCEKSEKPENSDIPVPMIKADVPAPVISGSGIASPSLIAYIANQKYTLALPLYRQEQEFSRNNLNLSRQTMANWLIYVSQYWLVPIYNSLRNILLLAYVLHADETSVQVLKEDGKPAESKSYIWLYRTGCDAEYPGRMVGQAGYRPEQFPKGTTGDAKPPPGPIVLYDYQPDRKHINAKSFLDGFSGYLHSDGYQAYNNLPSTITVVGCWAHLRRKFADILKSIPDYNKQGSLAMRGVLYCDKLFELEREYAKLPDDDNFKERYEARLEKSKPIIDEFFTWAESVYGKHIMATPKSNMGKALAYAMNQRTQLENVLCDGRLELSNNRAERSIKPFVIGRKNWLFSNTEKGADASALFYSIIETAKENGLKPYEYLKYIFETAPNLNLVRNPNAVETLLPWNAPDYCLLIAAENNE